MPTYKFTCELCQYSWELQQGVKETHTAECPKCGKQCTNNAFGGTGVVFAGQHMNKRLTGFPDNSRSINKEADALAKEYEEADQYMHKDIDKATREAAATTSQKKREKRSERFRKTE